MAHGARLIFAIAGIPIFKDFGSPLLRFDAIIAASVAFRAIYFLSPHRRPFAPGIFPRLFSGFSHPGFSSRLCSGVSRPEFRFRHFVGVSLRNFLSPLRRRFAPGVFSLLLIGVSRPEFCFRLFRGVSRPEFRLRLFSGVSHGAFSFASSAVFRARCFHSPFLMRSLPLRRPRAR